LVMYWEKYVNRHLINQVLEGKMKC